MRVPPFTSDRVFSVTSITYSAGTVPLGGWSRKLRIPEAERVAQHAHSVRVVLCLDPPTKWGKGQKGREGGREREREGGRERRGRERGREEGEGGREGERGRERERKEEEREGEREGREWWS